MGILNLKQTIQMTETEEKAVDWAYTAVKDGEDCFTDAKVYEGDVCTVDPMTALAATQQTSGKVASAKGTQGKVVIYGDVTAATSFYTVAKCAADKLTLHPFKSGEPADPASVKDTEIANSIAGD